MVAFEKKVKIVFTVISTLTFSGLLTFSGSILPSVFDSTATVPTFLLDVILWIASVIFVVTLVVLGIFSSEYYDYKNMKLFNEDLQDIIDYKLFNEEYKQKKKRTKKSS